MNNRSEFKPGAGLKTKAMIFNFLVMVFFVTFLDFARPDIYTLFFFNPPYVVITTFDSLSYLICEALLKGSLANRI